ncbi:antibiotic biosynthesis monooxygenase family protein [Tenacibaculum singaporense]|uniref:antibiotic biosynthesis monooxygenase family protein n=1 Tax=Tenacibaculum singaporense TaxID=2358479 RepID=UPI000F65A02E|nr:antibiotic biosynthesis monooxygenase [Tenacibaculum singaporense]RSC92877.1 hypothetical protein EI424_10550 [Tenacibaculum singaporense]
MNTEKYIAELVVYKIKPETTEKYTTEIIDFFRKLVMSFDGFISYEFLQSCKDDHTFMDLVLWDTLENAEITAKKVKEIQKGDKFKDYIESFEKVEIFNHFKPINLWKKADL